LSGFSRSRPCCRCAEGRLLTAVAAGVCRVI
jgi:hypothetical protein